MKSTRVGALWRPFFLWLTLIFSLYGATEPTLVFNPDKLLPDKEVAKIQQMGGELYEKTKVPVYLAVVADLNRSKPVEFLQTIQRESPTYIFLYFSRKPTSVNIFRSKDAEKLADYDQILSPLPWRGTIKPVMSPAFSKSEEVKLEVAAFNGYADLVDQVAHSRGVSLKSSIGSGSKESFLVVRWIFYAILAWIVVQFIYYKRKRRE